MQYIVLGWRNMATLGSSAGDRLLCAYLKALRNSNEACTEYVRAVRAGAPKPIRSKASVVKGTAVEVRAAREAFLQHIKKSGR